MKLCKRLWINYRWLGFGIFSGVEFIIRVEFIAPLFIFEMNQGRTCRICEISYKKKKKQKRTKTSPNLESSPVKVFRMRLFANALMGVLAKERSRAIYVKDWKWWWLSSICMTDVSPRWFDCAFGFEVKKKKEIENINPCLIYFV